MLAKNTLRQRRLTRLHIFPDEQHPFVKNIARFYEDPDLENITPAQWASMSAEDMIQQHEERQRARLAALFEKFGHQ
jgi:hypothetical protein